jgi:two-component sensor histidine kinase
MFKKIIFLVLVFLSSILHVNAQKVPGYPASDMKPSFQRLLLDLSTTYFTVVKENQVDLDSSLIHVSHSLSLSRLPVVTDGIDNKEVLNNAQWVDQRKPLIGQQQLNKATGEEHAALLMLLGAYYAFEPLNNSKAISQSINFLNQGIKESDKLNNISLKLAGQRLLGKLYLKRYDFVNADKLFAAVKEGYMQSGNQLEAATTCSWWGLYAPVTPTSTPPRIKHMEMALAVYKAMDDKEGQVNVLINDSYVHVLLYDFADAEKLEKQALGLTGQTGFPYSHYITGALLAITNFAGKFGEPLNYGIETTKRAETLRDSIGLPYFYLTVAQLYNEEYGNQEISIIWATKSINCFLSQHEPCYAILNNVVSYFLGLGRKRDALQLINKVVSQAPPNTSIAKFQYDVTIANYYSFYKNWSTVLKYLNKADSIANDLKKHVGFFGESYLYEEYAELYYHMGNYKKAKVYYQQFLESPDVHGLDLHNAILAWHALIAIDSIEGNKDAELRDYAKYMNLVNQNYTISKTRQAEELQVKYATTARENQIKALNQKAKLEQETLKQANRVKNITIVGIILVIIIAFLLYRQGAIRKKNNAIITGKNETMQRLLEEKEWLVKEIHHRVKNNLHTIICLLESQAAYLDNDALKAIETSQHRIYAMSLIHQKLYQSDDIKVLDMNIYITEFVQYLEESFGPAENVKVTLNIDNIKLEAAQAIPIGLIINEAVTNSYKYAFPGHQQGTIKIALHQSGNLIDLLISDNGIGMTIIDHFDDAGSLGMELIKGLSRDLKGRLELEGTNGTSIRILFEVNLLDRASSEQLLPILT